MIRVLRLLEYKYETVETMVRDMSNWAIPANGSTHRGSISVRSAVLPAEIFPVVEDAEVR